MSRVADRLGAIGTHATLCLAVGIFAGVLVPPLAAAARPLLTPAIFTLIVVTVVRLDPGSLRACLVRPRRVGLGVAWVLLGAPLVTLPVVHAAGGGFLGEHAILMAAAAPVISSAAYALILGLDVALALAVGVVATALVPFTLPPLAAFALGLELAISPWHLLARLTLLIGGASLVAAAIRRLLGAARLVAQSRAIDGVAVLTMLVFGAAAMDGVTATALAEPGFVLGCLAVVFTLAVGLNLAATLLFLRLGWRTAMTMGLVSGFNNFGVVVAAMGASADDRTVVFLGVAQLPIYLMPLALQHLVRRRQAREARP